MGVLSAIIAIILFVGLFYLAVNHAKIKGLIGEKTLISILRFLDKNMYSILNDVYIEHGQGTSQIDHIVVSKFGIFVIETKNYKGIISGSYKSDKWTQNIWGNKYSMPNPIRQNKAHLYALKSVLPNYAQSRCISIIAFSSTATLYVAVDEYTKVIYIRDVINVIKSYNEAIFSEEQVQEICNLISKANVIDKTVRNKHKYVVQQKVLSRNAQIAAGICPYCGAELVQRYGKYGSFIGCSRYPKCKFTTK